jgi:hypothetical protein
LNTELLTTKFQVGNHCLGLSDVDSNFLSLKGFVLLSQAIFGGEVLFFGKGGTKGK